jgi:hypothetical protein
MNVLKLILNGLKDGAFGNNGGPAANNTQGTSTGHLPAAVVEKPPQVGKYMCQGKSVCVDRT